MAHFKDCYYYLFISKVQSKVKVIVSKKLFLQGKHTWLIKFPGSDVQIKVCY